MPCSMDCGRVRPNERKVPRGERRARYLPDPGARAAEPAGPRSCRRQAGRHAETLLSARVNGVDAPPVDVDGKATERRDGVDQQQRIEAHAARVQSELKELRRPRAEFSSLPDALPIPADEVCNIEPLTSTEALLLSEMLRAPIAG